MAAYLDLDGFKSLSVIMPSDLDAFDAIRPGFVDATLVAHQSIIDARLRKRYAAPFAEPVPQIVLQWLVWVVTPVVQSARGVNPQDPQIERQDKERADAWAQIKEAADSKDGLFELPLREDNQASAVSVGGPLGYAEQSPYVNFDLEANAGRADDVRGCGS